MNNQLLSEINRLIRKGDPTVQSSKKQNRNSRRIFYALDDPSGLSLPGPDEHAIKFGRAELPVGARVTERDKKIARKAPPIPEPQSREDVPRYIAQLGSDDLFMNAMEKIDALGKDSPGGNVYNWTLGKHLGHKDAMDTLGKYYTLNWSDARKKMHNDAISRTVNKNAVAAPGDRKQFVLLMGSPGSGKSTYGTRFAKDYIQKQLSEINPDLTREHLSEYQGHNEAGTHRESQLLTFQPMLDHVYKNNHHIILNVPGSDQKQMEEVLSRARDRGYGTHLVYVDRNPYKSIAGTWKRFLVNPYGAKDPSQRPSRFVLPSYTLGIAEKPRQTYEGLKKSGLLHSFASIETPEQYNKEGLGYKIKETSHVRRRI